MIFFFFSADAIFEGDFFQLIYKKIITFKNYVNLQTNVIKAISDYIQRNTKIKLLKLQSFIYFFYMFILIYLLIILYFVIYCFKF